MILAQVDTICATATASGESGIGVIRVSGSHAIQWVDQLFRSVKNKSLASTESHRVLFGRFIEPASGKTLDEVLCTVMRAPRSYTGEDVVEVSAHGNPRILTRILEALLHCGARLADRGEFTKRAFLNGKLDLTQAEAVIDAVKAATYEGVDAAIDQLDGKLGKFLKELRADILQVLSPIEAGIDFPEEEVPEFSRDVVKEQIKLVVDKIDKALQGAFAGKILREGFSSVIVGKPNVGKSSLLNALLREKRAIVTDVPGTTRDTIEEWVEIGGLPMRLVDTAGIRATQDRVEQIGISRSKEAMAKGDLVLLVLDRSTPLEADDLELIQMTKEKKSLLILNKMDLNGPVCLEDLQKVYEGPMVPFSIVQNRGMDLLEQQITVSMLGNGNVPRETPLITRLRHQEGLERANDFLHESLETLNKKLPLDLVAADLRGAAESIGEITGEHYTDDLLEKIFSEFCIGK